MASSNNTGRQDRVKEAFVRYVMTGIDELLPITPALERFISRPREQKLKLCQTR